MKSIMECVKESINENEELMSVSIINNKVIDASFKLDNSYNNFIIDRFNNELEFCIKETIFKNIYRLYYFMNKIDNIYLCGSFALKVCSIKRTYEIPNDMDFYIVINNINEIPKILGDILCVFNNETIIIKNKTSNKYDFNTDSDSSDNLIVYEYIIDSYSIDFIFIFKNIKIILDKSDFSIIKNYITVDTDKSNNNKFIYNCLYFHDIMNSEINISQSYVDMIDKMLIQAHDNMYAIENITEKIIIRIKKYYDRGYKINNIGNNHLLIDKCCTCFEETYLLKNKFMCCHNNICLNCYKKLLKKTCPLCRSEKNFFTYFEIINDYYKTHQSYFLNNSMFY